MKKVGVEGLVLSLFIGDTSLGSRGDILDVLVEGTTGGRVRARLPFRLQGVQRQQ